MPTPLFVTSDWLNTHLDNENIQILDARMAPPGQESTIDIEAEYLACHLPHAVFFDIEALSDNHSNLPHMMPSQDTFIDAMSQLGISQDKHLIIYDGGNLFSAPRAWWMLKCFGVKNISILAGGLSQWQKMSLPLAQGHISSPVSSFKGELNTLAIKQLNDMLSVMEKRDAQILDARPAARFDALMDEPRPGLKRGHIPGAINIPWGSLVEDGCLKPPHVVTDLLVSQGVDLKKPIIASCGSGVTAAVIVLALASIGIDNVPIYDGAWSEWGSLHDLPIAP